MTSTIPRDAIKAGVTQTAALVTEYMPDGPATVINTGTDRIWLASGSQAGPSNGVPCEAGAFVTWKKAGELWAVLDPAATSATAQVYVSTAITAWEPSPAAVAGLVAAELLATGIPNVLVEDALPDVTVLRNSQSAPIDVSGYSSMQIFVEPQNSPGQNEMVYYYSHDGNDLLSGDYLSNTVQLVPVRARYIILTNQSTSTDVVVTIVGTNRTLPSNQDQSGGFTNTPLLYSKANGAMTAGAFYPLTLTNSNFNFGMPTGRCMLVMSLTSATAARGILNLTYTAPDGTTQNLPLMDSGEMHLDNTSGALFGYRETILPMNTNWQLQFQCRVAGTSAVTVSLVRDRI